MDDYIAGNKAAWEEAFDNRDASWGADITERIRKEHRLRSNQVINNFGRKTDCD